MHCAVIYRLKCAFKVRGYSKPAWEQLPQPNAADMQMTGGSAGIDRENNMGTDQIGNFIGQFMLSLLLSVAWLGICRLLPVLRRRIRSTRAHGIAALIAFAACMTPVASPGLARFAAGMLVALLLFIAWRRSLRNDSLNAATIISYVSDTVIGKR